MKYSMHIRLAAMGAAILLGACSSSDSTPVGAAGGGAGASGAAGQNQGGAAGQAGAGGASGASGTGGQGGAIAPQYFSCGAAPCDSGNAEGCCWDPAASTGTCVADSSAELAACMQAGSGKVVVACPGPICGAKSCCYRPSNSLAMCMLANDCESASGVLLCTEVAECPGSATGCTEDSTLKLPPGVKVCQYQ
jgi:hypothetical protein